MVKVQPGAVRRRNDALGAQHDAIGLAVVQCGEGIADFFLGELLRRLDAPALEDLVGVVAVMMVMMAAVVLVLILVMVVMVVMMAAVMLMLIIVFIVVMMVMAVMLILVIVVMMVAARMLVLVILVGIVMMMVMMVLFLFVLVVLLGLGAAVSVCCFCMASRICAPESWSHGVVMITAFWLCSRSRATAAASFSSEMEPVRLRMMAEAVSIWFV